MKKLAVERPFFLTWLGTYYMIHHSDVFIALDDCVFQSRTDFRSLWHRNNFDTQDNGSMTLPIEFKDSQLISTIKVSTTIKYIRGHLVSMKKILSEDPYTKEVFDEIVKPVYLSKHKFLIDFNMDMIFKVCEYLGIKTDHIVRSSELPYNRDDDLHSLIWNEECDKMLVSKGKALLIKNQTNNISALDQIFSVIPLKKILPKHFNILEILCKYGKGTMQIIDNEYNAIVN